MDRNYFLLLLIRNKVAATNNKMLGDKNKLLIEKSSILDLVTLELNIFLC